MIRSYSGSMDLIRNSDINREEQNPVRVWLLHELLKQYPFVPTVMQNVLLCLPFFLKKRKLRIDDKIKFLYSTY